MVLVSKRTARMWSKRWSSEPPDPGPLTVLTVKVRRSSMLESVEVLRRADGDELDEGG